MLQKMKAYLSLDAGGSKCAAVLFDEEFTLLASAQTGGVNTTQNSPEISRKNMEACIGALAAQSGVAALECAYVTIVGPIDILKEVISERFTVGNWCIMGEPVGGLWSALLKPCGIFALAGTGSDVFWIDPAAPKKQLRSDGRLCDLAPTMLELMGLAKPAEMTGESLIEG